MNIGDRVISSGVIRTSGTLTAILPRGVNPGTPQFTHQVELDKPYRGFQFMRFDPVDLALASVVE